VNVVERHSESSHDEVHVAASEGTIVSEGFIPIATGPTAELFQEAFRFTLDWGASEIVRANQCGLDTLLVEYAGFDENDLAFVWPQELEA
jgi:hypothetical protein